MSTARLKSTTKYESIPTVYGNFHIKLFSSYSYRSLVASMDDIPCISCVLSGGSCCLDRQIVLTLGDVQRVKARVGHCKFFTVEKPEPWYLDPFYDPAWLPLVLNPEGLFRVLKRNSDKSCGMLVKTGCILPLESRPLVCQLHPYTYTETEILGIDDTCPISKERDGFAILDRLNMPMNKAIGWQHLLYKELHAERDRKSSCFFAKQQFSN